MPSACLRRGHLGAAVPGHVAVRAARRGLAELVVEDVAGLATGAGHDEHLVALGHVLRRGRRPLARLVVGVGVDGHQTVGHGGSSLRGDGDRRRAAHSTRELPWDQDIHPGSPELSEQLPDATATLDDRYGRTPARSRRSRLVAIVAAIAIVVVFGAWVIWAGPGQSARGLDSDDVGYEVLSEHSTVVHSQVSVDPGAEREVRRAGARQVVHDRRAGRTITLPRRPSSARGAITTAGQHDDTRRDRLDPRPAGFPRLP